MSVPLEQSSIQGKGKALVPSALAESDASSHGYTDSERIDIQILDGGSALSDP